jgi:hypothetical protein
MAQSHAASGAARGGSSDRDAATPVRRARRGRQRPGNKEEGATASAAVREVRQEAQDRTGLVQRRGGRGDGECREAGGCGEEGRRLHLGSELGRRRGRLAPGGGPDGAAVPLPGAPAGIALRAAPGCTGAVMDGAAEERVPARRRRRRGAGAHGGRRPRRRGVLEVLPVAQERADAEPILHAACPGDRRRTGGLN